MPRPLKYAPLRDHLKASGGETVRLSFDEIGRLVDGLPRTAAIKSAWWGNEAPHGTQHVQCKAWQEAGYSVAIDRKAGVATFRRRT